MTTPAVKTINHWSSKFPIPPEDQQHTQHKWNELFYEQLYSSLLISTLNEQYKSHLLSMAFAEAGAWLNVYSLCLHWVLNLMMSHGILPRLGLHLGAAIIVKHACICGATVDSYGTHGLSCWHSGGHLPCHMHASVNETSCALVSGGMPLFLNPLGFVVMMVNGLMVGL